MFPHPVRRWEHHRLRRAEQATSRQHESNRNSLRRFHRPEERCRVVQSGLWRTWHRTDGTGYRSVSSRDTFLLSRTCTRSNLKRSSQNRHYATTSNRRAGMSSQVIQGPAARHHRFVATLRLSFSWRLSGSVQQLSAYNAAFHPALSCLESSFTTSG